MKFLIMGNTLELKDDIIKGVFKFLCGNGNYEQEIAYRISKAFLKPYSEKEIKDIFEKNDMETIKRRTEFVILYELIELCKGISKIDKLAKDMIREYEDCTELKTALNDIRTSKDTIDIYVYGERLALNKNVVKGNFNYLAIPLTQDEYAMKIACAFNKEYTKENVLEINLIRFLI